MQKTSRAAGIVAGLSTLVGASNALASQTHREGPHSGGALVAPERGNRLALLLDDIAAQGVWRGIEQGRESLAAGSRGAAVVALQRVLNAAPESAHAELVIDGIFGPQTERALVALNFGLHKGSAPQRFDRTSLRLLQERVQGAVFEQDMEASEGEFSSLRTPARDRVWDLDSIVVAPIPSAPPQGLRRGSSGSEVRALQRFLNEIGQERLVADGRFGPRTEQALASAIRSHISPEATAIAYTPDIESAFRTLFQPASEVPLQYRLLAPELIQEFEEHYISRTPLPHGQSAGPRSRMDNVLVADHLLRGFSREAGGAIPEVQRRVIELALLATKDWPLEDRATFLAVMHHESRLNPDAATPTTSAAGLFQIIEGTEKNLHLDNVFNAEENIIAAKQLFEEYFRYANVRNNSGVERGLWIYAIHHDGPAARRGGAGWSNATRHGVVANQQDILRILSKHLGEAVNH